LRQGAQVSLHAGQPRGDRVGVPEKDPSSGGESHGTWATRTFDEGVPHQTLKTRYLLIGCNRERRRLD
jgi:hypothetical protein